MAIDPLRQPSQGIPLATNKTEVDRAEIKRLAQQFEAMLMTQMLRDMRKSMVDDEEGDEESGFGADAFADTADAELGGALSKAGGVGLTDTLLKAFERQIDPGGQSDGSVQPADATTTGAVDTAGNAVSPGTAGTSGTTPDSTTGGVTESAPVSSAFGWRRDPLTGVEQFHQGVDIAVAYGRDVKAAAAGTVAFAGVQNGYGQTVVINHDGGRQTRYAHLSEPLVRTGDAVSEGQIVGRSGNSGRSTGPHLHFEMLVDGKPIDPTRVAVAE